MANQYENNSSFLKNSEFDWSPLSWAVDRYLILAANYENNGMIEEAELFLEGALELEQISQRVTNS